MGAERYVLSPHEEEMRYDQTRDKVMSVLLATWHQSESPMMHALEPSMISPWSLPVRSSVDESANHQHCTFKAQNTRGKTIQLHSLPIHTHSYIHPYLLSPYSVLAKSSQLQLTFLFWPCQKTSLSHPSPFANQRLDLDAFQGDSSLAVQE